MGMSKRVQSVHELFGGGVGDARQVGHVDAVCAPSRIGPVGSPKRKTIGNRIGQDRAAYVLDLCGCEVLAAEKI